MQYLTVQDILWINLQVTKKVHHFNHAKLLEATSYQYAYGASNSLVPQTARFLSGFLRMRPLDVGNEATAFVAALAFLRANGQDVNLKDESGSEWYMKAVQGRDSAKQEVEKSISPLGDHHHEDVRTAIRAILDRFPCTLSGLSRLSQQVA